MTGRAGYSVRHVVDKQAYASSLLVHDPEYAGVAAHDDAAGDDKRDDEQRRFGRVATAVFQDGAGPQFTVQTEHTCNTHILVVTFMSHLIRTLNILVNDLLDSDRYFFVAL